MRLRLPQTVCYFAPTGTTAYGRPVLAAPVALPGRWEDEIAETINAEGVNVLSQAIVYLSTDVLVGGVLFLGSIQDLGSAFPYSNPKADKRTFEIINKGRIPNLKGTQFLVKATVQ